MSSYASRYASRAGRWPLALTLGALAALGACTDGPAATAPGSNPRPNLAVGDVITVTNTKGGTDVGSLRWAVAQTTGGEVIRFDPRLAGATITLDSTLVIQNSVTIEGPQDKGMTISGGGKGRVIDVAPVWSTVATATLRNLSITGGKLASGGGAGIRTSGPLVLDHGTVWGNEAVGAAAIDAIGDASTITITNSTISGNTNTQPGSAAVAASNGLRMYLSTVAYNSGEGISVSEYARGSVGASILAHNGGLYCLNTGSVTYSFTITDDPWCDEDYEKPADVVVADPKLESLADNGGPGMTHALAPLSPALNVLSGCSEAVDERYVARVGACDLGAYESTDPKTVSIVVDPSATFDPATGVTFLGGTLECSRAGDYLTVRVQLQQRSVVGTSGVSVPCGTSPQRWSALIAPSAGVFKNGPAAVTTTVQQAPSWVAPGTTSRSIKLRA